MLRRPHWLCYTFENLRFSAGEVNLLIHDSFCRDLTVPCLRGNVPANTDVCTHTSGACKSLEPQMSSRFSPLTIFLCFIYKITFWNHSVRRANRQNVCSENAHNQRPCPDHPSVLQKFSRIGPSGFDSANIINWSNFDVLSKFDHFIKYCTKKTQHHDVCKSRGNQAFRVEIESGPEKFVLGDLSSVEINA